MPHVHMLYLNCGYWPQGDVQKAWTAALGGLQKARVEISEARGARQVGFYVAKYIGKLPLLSSLVIDAYLNNCWPGRKWGILRKKALPLCPKNAYRIRPDEDWRYICEMAADCWKGIENTGEQGFTLFGKGAEWIAEFCRDNDLDKL